MGGSRNRQTPLVRLWAVSIRPGAEAEYLAFARERSRAMFLAQPGCLGVLFLGMADGRHAACSLWRDAAAIEALASSPSYRETAAALLASGLLAGTPEVQVHALEGGALDLAALAEALSGA